MEVQDIARAIIGPWFPVPEGSKFSLRELRDVRWDMATRAERGEALNAALAVHREIEQAAINARSAAINECARHLEASYPDHAWLNAACAALRSLALARCSSQVEQPQ